MVSVHFGLILELEYYKIPLFFINMPVTYRVGGGGGGVHPPFPGQKCLISPARLGIFSRNFDNVDKT